MAPSKNEFRMFWSTCAKCHADDRVTIPEINYESGPSVTSTEVKHVVKKLKNSKATGTDLIAAEIMKSLDDGPSEKLAQL